MSINDPAATAEAVTMLSRATLRVSKSLSPDDSTLADAVAHTGNAIAGAIQAPYGMTLAEAVVIGLGGGEPNSRNVPDALSGLGGDIDRGFEAVATAITDSAWYPLVLPILMKECEWVSRADEEHKRVTLFAAAGRPMLDLLPDWLVASELVRAGQQVGIPTDEAKSIVAEAMKVRDQS